MFKEFEHPLVIDFIEKASDICLNDMVDILLLDCLSQFVQALVWTPIGAISITAVFESLLVDWLKNLLDR